MADIRHRVGINAPVERVYHALATTDGLPTNALLGFANMLFKLLADYRPKGVAVAWDSRPVERHAAAAELQFDSTIRLDHERNNALEFALDDYALDYPFSYSSEEIPDLSRSIDKMKGWRTTLSHSMARNSCSASLAWSSMPLRLP